MLYPRCSRHLISLPFLHLVLDLYTGQSSSTQLKRSALPTHHELTQINYNDKMIRVIQRSAAKWEKIGIRLYFNGSMIGSIRRDSNFLTEEACATVFIMWLDMEMEGLRQPRTWDTVVKVLKESGLGELSEELNSVLSE